MSPESTRDAHPQFAVELILRKTILKGDIPMNIEQKRNGNALTIAPEGYLDTTTAPELGAVLETALEGVKELTFDLEKLEYISSSGLRQLLFAQKTMGRKGSMKVINANETVREIFEITGFSDFLTIE